MYIYVLAFENCNGRSPFPLQSFNCRQNWVQLAELCTKGMTEVGRYIDALILWVGGGREFLMIISND